MYIIKPHISKIYICQHTSIYIIKSFTVYRINSCYIFIALELELAYTEVIIKTWYIYHCYFQEIMTNLIQHLAAETIQPYISLSFLVKHCVKINSREVESFQYKNIYLRNVSEIMLCHANLYQVFLDDILNEPLVVNLQVIPIDSIKMQLSL